MSLAQKARVLVGVLASLTLLTLIILDFLMQELMLTRIAILVLLALISGTLGIDMAMDKLPIRITVNQSENQSDDS